MARTAMTNIIVITAITNPIATMAIIIITTIRAIGVKYNGYINNSGHYKDNI